MTTVEHPIDVARLGQTCWKDTLVCYSGVSYLEGGSSSVVVGHVARSGARTAVSYDVQGPVGIGGASRGCAIHSVRQANKLFAGRAFYGVLPDGPYTCRIEGGVRSQGAGRPNSGVISSAAQRPPATRIKAGHLPFTTHHRFTPFRRGCSSHVPPAAYQYGSLLAQPARRPCPGRQPYNPRVFLRLRDSVWCEPRRMASTRGKPPTRDRISLRVTASLSAAVDHSQSI